MFDKLGRLLAKYLSEEYLSRKIKTTENVQECFDEHSFAISFNYTDTIKLYTDNYYYVHGSSTDDDYIIWGFATGELPCLCSEKLIKYLKEVKKEVLSFLRFLRANNCNNIKEDLTGFIKHVLSLFSGSGEYNLEYQNGNRSLYNTKELSSYIFDYAKSNSFKGHKAPFDYSNVKEIIVMGHGLESDLNYLTETFEKVPQIQKVILYTYDEEAMYEKERKISILKKYRE